MEDSVYRYEDGKIWKEYHFYETGQLADSIFYNPKTEMDSGFSYFPNGKIQGAVL